MGFNLIKARAVELTSLVGGGFTTSRLAVAPLKVADLLAIGEGFDAPAVWRFSRGIDSIESANAWLAGTLNDPSREAFAIRVRHSLDLAGFFVLSRWGGAGVEVGGWLSYHLWNRGLGRELLEAITCRMAEQPYSLMAEVDPSNGAAIHLLQCVGFVLGDGVWMLG